MKKHTKNTPIVVTGCLSNIANRLGYVGYIEKIWSEEETHDGKILSLKLIPPLPLSKSDKRSEDDPRYGRFNSTCDTARPDQVRALTNPKELERVKRFRSKEEAAKKAETAEETAEERAKWEKILEDIDDMVGKDLEKQEDQAKSASKFGTKWKLPGAIKRGDKSQFCSYYHPVIQEAEAHVRKCAAVESVEKDCTEEDMVRWAEANELTDQASFWSSSDECRSAVHEFDLDPFKDEFCAALYLPRSHTYVPKGQLRQAIIKIWNNGEEILDIRDMDGPQTCHDPNSGKEAWGYSISHAKRRKLPS